MMKNILVILLLISTIIIKAQTLNWVRIIDSQTQTEFSMPENPMHIDTLSTVLYSTSIDSTEALQVHIFDNASFNSNDPIFSNALIQENGDTLRAIAKVLVLFSNSEIISLNEIYTNGHRGMILGIKYLTLQSNLPSSSFIKYYFENNKFISFTWTGNFTSMRRVSPNQGLPTPPTFKDAFFESVEFQ